MPTVLPEARATDLQIAGINAMSSVDWPGKLVATVFTQGCPWRCAYCHNQAIIDPTLPGVVDWSALEKLMARRHGLLDGVVFSGGEATRQWALLPAIRQVRAWGFEVGLHTAGPYPTRLRTALDEGLVGWVGVDIKALPGAAYDQVAGRPHAGEKAWESLGIVLDSGVDYEVRLTLEPRGYADAVAVAQLCRDTGVRTFALQEVRLQGVSDDYATRAERTPYQRAKDAAQLARIDAQIRGLGFDSYTFRPAQ